jgi:hypothetical protein
MSLAGLGGPYVTAGKRSARRGISAHTDAGESHAGAETHGGNAGGGVIGLTPAGVGLEMTGEHHSLARSRDRYWIWTTPHKDKTPLIFQMGE